MSTIHNVTLELVRSGPAHNQLLSPLTPYIALCGGDSPVSVHLPFEHHQLLLRLQRLRYELQGNTEAQNEQRQGELLDIGRLLGDALGTIPALLAELSRARRQGGQLVHLRLSLSASELGMVPFEAAIAPAGFPGSGSPLFLQSNTPVSVTREIRRGHPLPLDWNRPPRILFAFASPPEFPPVPAEEHLQALRTALDPWLKDQDDPPGRLKEIKRFLTVLPDASLQDIRAACVEEDFTHVHILAHGAPISIAGDQRYGIALCRQDDKSQWKCVDGDSLAFTLTGKDAVGDEGRIPTLVSLSTCDSGNLGSPLTPGGSIAHALHAAGIPWVIASQFPLWMKASAIATRELFSGILDGEDPRWVLYGLRQKLRTDCPDTHDWASIVTYATLPGNFAQQVQRFRDEQMKGRLDVKLDRLDRAIKRVHLKTSKGLTRLRAPRSGDSTAARSPGDELDELAELDRETSAQLQRWRESVDDDSDRGAEAAQRLARHAAWKKRLGVAYEVINKALHGESKRAAEGALTAYRESRELYREAVEAEPCSTWLATQFLALNAVPALRNTPTQPPLGIAAEDLWLIALKLARGERRSLQGVARASVQTTIVELAVLATRYATKQDAAEAAKEVEKALKDIQAMEERDRRPGTALAYQLRRYQEHWKPDGRQKLVERALKTLRPDTELHSDPTAAGGESNEDLRADLARPAVAAALDSPVASIAPGSGGAEPCEPAGEREGSDQS